MAYWLLKSDPDTWSWEDQVKEGVDYWDGVRNPQAANNLKAMKKGDRAFFYHSQKEKAIRGVVEIVREHYPDPTDPTGRHVAVDVKPVKAVKKPVTLDEIKADPRLSQIALVRQSRLSVMPIDAASWKLICAMAGIEA